MAANAVKPKAHGAQGSSPTCGACIQAAPFLTPGPSFTVPATGSPDNSFSMVYTAVKGMDKSHCFQQWSCWHYQTLETPDFLKQHFSFLCHSCMWPKNSLPVLSRRVLFQPAQFPHWVCCKDVNLAQREVWPWPSASGTQSLSPWYVVPDKIFCLSVLGQLDGDNVIAEGRRVVNHTRKSNHVIYGGGFGSYWYLSTSKTAGAWGRPHGQSPKFMWSNSSKNSEQWG